MERWYLNKILQNTNIFHQAQKIGMNIPEQCRTQHYTNGASKSSSPTEGSPVMWPTSSVVDAEVCLLLDRDQCFDLVCVIVALDGDLLLLMVLKTRLEVSCPLPDLLLLAVLLS